MQINSRCPDCAIVSEFSLFLGNLIKTDQFGVRRFNGWRRTSAADNDWGL